jgi:hypothetical protein
MPGPPHTHKLVSISLFSQGMTGMTGTTNPCAMPLSWRHTSSVRYAIGMTERHLRPRTQNRYSTFIPPLHLPLRAVVQHCFVSHL